jgi:hypothetical protein
VLLYRTSVDGEIQLRAVEFPDGGGAADVTLNVGSLALAEGLQVTPVADGYLFAGTPPGSELRVAHVRPGSAAPEEVTLEGWGNVYLASSGEGAVLIHDRWSENVVEWYRLDASGAPVGPPVNITNDVPALTIQAVASIGSATFVVGGSLDVTALDASGQYAGTWPVAAHPQGVRGRVVGAGSNLAVVFSTDLAAGLALLAP